MIIVIFGLLEFKFPHWTSFEWKRERFDKKYYVRGAAVENSFRQVLTKTVIASDLKLADWRGTGLGPIGQIKGLQCSSLSLVLVVWSMETPQRRICTPRCGDLWTACYRGAQLPRQEHKRDRLLFQKNVGKVAKVTELNKNHNWGLDL